MGQRSLKTSVTTFFLLLLLVSPATGCGGGAQADIVFVVDASGSVGSSNFQKLLEFVRDMVLSFDIGSNLIRVGLEKFESRQYVEFHLNKYYDRNAMASRVMTTYYTRGGTYTGRAINYMRDTMFNSKNGDRSSAPNIGVIITDGRSNSYSETSRTSASARSKGITIFSIGVGYGYSLSELNVMATDPDSQHVFTVNDFNKMGQIKSAFASQACPPTHGNWGSWGSWSGCSRTCGGGSRSHSRSCNNPAPANGGNNCAGSSTETASCNTQSCAVNGNWGAWGSWGSCSRTCGGGSRTHSRSCNNPPPSNGGASCPGSSSQTGSCNTQNCPIDGNWGSWTSWGSCSTTCALGTLTRTRSCNNPPAQYGGAACPGAGSDTTSCNLRPCPIDGVWGTWTSWGTCSTTCALGTMTRSRTCDNPAPQYGGATCPGSATGSTSCNLRPCPVDGNWASWGSWVSCTTTCGPGTWSRSRTCTNPAPAHGGASCGGVNSETSACNLRPCPIDGAWSTWQAWSACSVTCMGIGVRGRLRLCDNPTPMYGGAQCPGASSETETCNRALTLCSVGNGWAPQTYSTTPGTPVNGGFGPWGSWSACSKSCGAGIQMRMRQCNNPVPQFGGDLCSGDFVEKQMCNNIACPGGSGYIQTCPERYFDCKSGNITCVHYLRKCDCLKDCDDASDEDVEWAGCTVNYDQCTNRAYAMSPVSIVTFLLLCLATVIPQRLVWVYQ